MHGPICAEGGLFLAGFFIGAGPSRRFFGPASSARLGDNGARPGLIFFQQPGFFVDGWLRFFESP